MLRRPLLPLALVDFVLLLAACAQPAVIGKSDWQSRDAANSPDASGPLDGAMTSGTWSSTGSLAAARGAHTATLLPSGKVLVVGGFTSTYTALQSSELYDPSSGTWSSTGSLATARGAHTATLLPSGKVLVVGGNNPDALASAELYDPRSGTWTTTGSMAAARESQTATLLPSGKVLVAGGDNGFGILASAELYDPGSGTWSTAGSLATARDGHTATLLPSGKVLVVGGNDSPSLTALASAELYDPSSGTWSATGSLTTGRSGHTATLLRSGNVLVAGGVEHFRCVVLTASAELYDPVSGTWSTTGSLATARSDHTATLLGSGTVLVASGSDNNPTTGVTATAEVYAPASGVWSPAGSIAMARYSHTATLLPSGEVLTVGGYLDYSNALASAELYSP